MINEIIKILQRNIKNYEPPLVEKIINEYGKKPFLILVSCLLSLRAKDIATIHVCRKLFAKAKTPKQILAIPLKDLERIIFKIGFYKNKAKALQQVSQTILNKYKGKVPDNLQDLISIKHVGRKTANLVLGAAFDKPVICVDIHVHRISNRLGIIKTLKVASTELALQKILPQKYWTKWNNLLVVWGQNVCTPLSPKCNICKLNKPSPLVHRSLGEGGRLRLTSKICKKVGVKKHR